MSESLAVVENYWKKEGEKDLDGILDCFHPDATFSAPITEDLRGIGALREFYTGVLDGFANSNVTIDRSTESGERVAAEFTLSFEQHDGAMGQASGCNVFTVRAGKIVEVRCYFDPASFSA